MKQIGVIAIVILSFFSCQKKEEEKLLLASASSLHLVMEELVSIFSKEENIQVDLISASSGKLTTQIELGAPYDIFLSANEKYPNYLQSKLNINDSLLVFAYGRLVLLVSKKIKIQRQTVELLLEANIQKIAIPNSELAPYGIASMEIIENLVAKNKVKKKLVFGENVNQTNQFLKSQVVDVGFTSLSSIHNSFFQANYKIVSIPDSLYNPIKNTVLVVSKNNIKKKKAQKFKAFLQGDKAKNILQKYGYNIPK